MLLPEIITLQEATQVSGKSVRQLRRYVKDGKLQNHQANPTQNSQILLSLTELRAYLSTLPQSRQNGGKGKVRQKRVDVNVHVEELSNLRAQVGALGAQLAMQEELNREFKDRIKELKDDKRTLLAQVEDLRRRLDDSQDARAALEREMNGGVRGLLKGAIKKFW